MRPAKSAKRMFPSKVNKEANQENKSREYQSKKFISQKDHIFELGNDNKDKNVENDLTRCNSKPNIKVNFIFKITIY